MLAEAEGLHLFLVQEAGPTCFVLEDEAGRNHRVSIGARQECSTCSPSGRGTRLCPHILFVMLRVFRVPKENPVVWQLSLVDLEIEKLLSGRMLEMQARGRKARARTGEDTAADSSEDTASPKEPEGPATIFQKKPQPGETCPICQEEMAEGDELTFCSLGCGNSIHIACMRHYARHQISIEKPVKCPLCRTLWGPIPEPEEKRRSQVERRKDAHYGVTCNGCRQANFAGTRFRCLYCNDYNLCQSCYLTSTHAHPFQQKSEPSGTWEYAPERKVAPALSPEAVADLQGREITADDYEMLLQLDDKRQSNFATRHPLLETRLGSDVASSQQSNSPRPGDSAGSMQYSIQGSSIQGSMPRPGSESAPSSPEDSPVGAGPVQIPHSQTQLQIVMPHTKYSSLGALKHPAALRRGHMRPLQEAAVGSALALCIAGETLLESPPQSQRHEKERFEAPAAAAAAPPSQRRGDTALFPPLPPAHAARPIVQRPRRYETVGATGCRAITQAARIPSVTGRGQQTRCPPRPLPPPEL